MEIKQRTIAEIAETERLLLAYARERYPVYYPQALEASLFLSNFIKSVDPDRSVFVMFLSQLKKHHTLALFSTVRLHQRGITYPNLPLPLSSRPQRPGSSS